MRITKFRDRLLLVIVLLLAAVLGLNFVFVRQANIANARRAIDEDLRSAAQVFERVLRLRLEKLALGARLMSDDWAFRQLYGDTENFTDPVQRRTLVSGLENYRSRIRDSAFLQLVSLEGELQADTARPELQGLPAYDFPALLAEAEESEDLRAIRFQVSAGGSLVLAVAVPLLLPEPTGWIVAGFPVDDAFAADFRDLTGVEVSFLRRTEQGPLVVASSLPAGTPATAAAARLSPEPREGTLFDNHVDGETWLGMQQPLPGGVADVILQRCLSREMVPFRRLETALTMLTLAGLVGSALAAVWLARGISRPVLDLSAGARRVGAGVYNEPVPVRSQDELGQLAAAFNGMTRGLVERDKVRDLLGRNVSPEVAAELLRRPAALGGEEREATILFTDIRGFTSLGESAQPSELLELLNAYFTELTRVIEDHGGVVDKYIGDAVMAVFGAPVVDGDHAAHAVKCARAIGRVMRVYNENRLQKNLPRLETGIGVASGTVVAGLMGSVSRHNYTVIGDTVNLAARLQDETKRFGVSPVVAGSTVLASGLADWFTPLGEVIVRGKKDAVDVFTLREDGPGA